LAYALCAAPETQGVVPAPGVRIERSAMNVALIINQPSLRDYVTIRAIFPGLKVRGYIQSSLRD